MARRSARGKYGPRGSSFTEIKAKEFAAQIEEEFGEIIDSQFNGFLKSIINDLTNTGTLSQKGGVSPVLTGFFASSWKADIRPIKRTENKEDFPEWRRIKYKTFKKSKDDKGVTRLLPGYKPLIRQRHPFNPVFTREKTAYIGNTAKYAPYAVISPKSKINAYLQSGSGPFKENLKQKINRFFSDGKRPDIRVGGGAQEIPNTQPKEYRTTFLKL